VSFRIGERLAYRGKRGCQHPLCTRRGDYNDRCYGWHCANCDGASSYQGHTTIKDGQLVFLCGPPILSREEVSA
jgi:hypothetical protein